MGTPNRNGRILAYSSEDVIELQDYSNETIMSSCRSGRGAARLARLHGVQEVGGSNPLAPTEKDSRKRVFFYTTWLAHGVGAPRSDAARKSTRPDRIEILVKESLFVSRLARGVALKHQAPRSDATRKSSRPDRKGLSEESLLLLMHHPVSARKRWSSKPSALFGCTETRRRRSNPRQHLRNCFGANALAMTGYGFHLNLDAHLFVSLNPS